jgi:XTP/dITP diphosphohydrolase
VTASASFPARRTVVVATSNKGKLRELRALLADLPIDLLPLAEALPRPLEIIEDGDTFEENARKKARVVAQATALPALADDSGLEVDDLDGRPGVRSARFAGERATDAENNRKLLYELEALAPYARRRARFRCVVVLVDPTRPEETIEASGACEGAIAPAPRGHGGFGYDPIFLVEAAQGRTMAELGDEEKNALSHRARAIADLVPKLRNWIHT